MGYPPQPRYKAGIFPTREKVMNGRKARFAHCPICQERSVFALVSIGRAGVLQHYRLPGTWPLSGSSDGDTPCDGQWHGRSTVPVLTDIQRELFQQTKANEPILCRRGKPSTLGGETAGRMTPATISSEIPLLCAQKDVDRWSASFLPWVRGVPVTS